MFRLFIICLAGVILLFSFKAYEQQTDGLLVFSNSRRWLDRKLTAAGSYVAYRFWQAVDCVSGAIGWVFQQCRQLLAGGLHKLARLIDLR